MMRKTGIRAVAAGFLLAALWTVTPFAAASESVAQQVVRLHVVAHSDREADQALKLKVRDAVLAEAARWTADAATRDEASAALCLHLGAVEAAARQALEREGSSQAVAVSVTDSYFPTREYDSFALPAGIYRTLRVTLGEGAGHNWWCVVFPELCLPAAGENRDPLAVWPEGQKEVMELPHSGEIQVKLKVIELYQQLRELFRQG